MKPTTFKVYVHAEEYVDEIGIRHTRTTFLDEPADGYRKLVFRLPENNHFSLYRDARGETCVAIDDYQCASPAEIMTHNEIGYFFGHVCRNSLHGSLYKYVLLDEVPLTDKEAYR